MTSKSMHHTPLGRAAAVAQEYDSLMGLGYVALGAGFLVAAATAQPAVWIALGAAFCAMATGWYQRRYGFVRPRAGRVARMGVGAAVAIVVILTAFVLDRWLTPPVSLSLLAVVLVLGGGQALMLRRVGLTPVHWIVYALLVVAAFGPLLGLGAGDLLSPYVLIVTGLALVAVGVTDHLRLVRAVGVPPQEDRDDQR